RDAGRAIAGDDVAHAVARGARGAADRVAAGPVVDDDARPAVGDGERLVVLQADIVADHQVVAGAGAGDLQPGAGVARDEVPERGIRRAADRVARGASLDDDPRGVGDGGGAVGVRADEVVLD